MNEGSPPVEPVESYRSEDLYGLALEDLGHRDDQIPAFEDPSVCAECGRTVMAGDNLLRLEWVDLGVIEDPQTTSEFCALECVARFAAKWASQVYVRLEASEGEPMPRFSVVEEMAPVPA